MQRYHSALWAGLCLMAWLLGAPSAWSEKTQTLRVCADPDNMPFSNRKEQGFENKIAALVAAELGGSPVYTWSPQRRGFARYTLNAKRCDVIIGVPAGYGRALSTKPYYAAPYVVVARRDRDVQITSLDDPVLQQLRLGVYQNSPPDIALVQRQIVDNVIGYSTFFDGETRHPRKIIDDVLTRQIDVAILWGPAASYFVRQQANDLTLTPIPMPRLDRGSDTPQSYAMAMGVRKGDEELKAQLDAVIDRKQAEITRILEQYGVPLVAIQ